MNLVDTVKLDTPKKYKKLKQNTQLNKNKNKVF